MRHSEISEAPAEAGHYLLPGRVEESRAERTDDLFATVCVRVDLQKLSRIKPLRCKYNDRDRQQSHQHQNTLEEVCPAYRLETAEKGIGNYYYCKYQHSCPFGHVLEELGEDCCSGDECRRDINGKCNKENDRADYLQYFRSGSKSICKILRYRYRVICCLRKFPQSFCTEDPVGRSAQGKTYADPHLAEAESKNGTGKPHQKPARHIRSLS